MVYLQMDCRSDYPKDFRLDYRKVKQKEFLQMEIHLDFQMDLYLVILTDLPMAFLRMDFQMEMLTDNHLVMPMERYLVFLQTEILMVNQKDYQTANLRVIQKDFRLEIRSEMPTEIRLDLLKVFLRLGCRLEIPKGFRLVMLMENYLGLTMAFPLKANRLEIQKAILTDCSKDLLKEYLQMAIHSEIHLDL